jgi:hypothetical protein
VFHGILVICRRVWAAEEEAIVCAQAVPLHEGPRQRLVSCEWVGTGGQAGVRLRKIEMSAQISCVLYMRLAP